MGSNLTKLANKKNTKREGALDKKKKKKKQKKQTKNKAKKSDAPKPALQ